MSIEKHSEDHTVSVPDLISGSCAVQTAGKEAGSIVVDCEVTDDFSRDEMNDHFRLEIPGEVNLLTPAEVTGEEGHYKAGFFSSDIANSGHLPADCVAVWDREDEEQVPLGHLSCKTIEQSDEITDENQTAPINKTDLEYPRTVGLATAVVVLLAGILWITFVLMSL